MICSNCGQENGSLKFCTKCGERQEASGSNILPIASLVLSVGGIIGFLISFYFHSHLIFEKTRFIGFSAFGYVNPYLHFIYLFFTIPSLICGFITNQSNKHTLKKIGFILSIVCLFLMLIISFRFVFFIR